MSGDPEAHAGAAGAGDHIGADQVSDDELRAAYEEELNRITSAELMLQSAVSLLNLAARRLGLAPAPGAGGDAPPAAGGRDLEQVREAIDGVRALFGVLERRFARDIAPLRDALSQLQIAYAREAQTGSAPAAAADAPAASPPAEGAEPAPAPEAKEGSDAHKPGPAESSGRLWVPGR
jgi:hypothetical protein